MKIAYLTTEYPNVSHTFIRREIAGLEALDVPIKRYSLRQGTVVDAADQTEANQTTQILGRSLTWTLTRLAGGLLRSRMRLLPAIYEALVMARRSDRGVLRHMAYVAEALILLDLCWQDDVGHLHVHFGTNVAAIALLVQCLGGPRFSFTVHGPDEFDSPIGFSIGKKVHESLFTIAISHYCSAQIKRWADVEDWNKVHIVRCTVGAEWFEADESCLPVGTHDFVSVGRLSAQKGQLLLVNAFSHACSQGIAGKLVLVGDGELREILENRVRELGLEERVIFFGWADGAQIRELIRNSRAMVVSSFAEGLPVVIMESMAIGRPVLATRITGIPELIEEDRNGWLVAAGDEEGLSRELVKVSRLEEEVLERLGRNARADVAEKHSQVLEAETLKSIFAAYGVIPEDTQEITASGSQL